MKKYLLWSLVLSAFVVNNCVYANDFWGTVNNINGAVNYVNNQVNNVGRTYSNIKNTPNNSYSNSPNNSYSTNSNNSYSASPNSYNMRSNTYSNNTQTKEHLKGSGYSKVCQNGKCGIQDDFEDRLISEIKYDDIAVVPDTGYLKLKNGNKFALFNTSTGREASNFVFDAVEPIHGSSTYIKVLQNGKWAIIELNTSGTKQLSEYKYDQVGDLIWSGFYKVYNANKCGAFYVGKRNGGAYEMSAGEVVPPYFEDVDQLGTKNYFKIRQNGLWGVYNTDTKSVVIEPMYENSAIQYRGFDTFRINGQEVKANVASQVTSINNPYQNNVNNTTNLTVSQSANVAPQVTPISNPYQNNINYTDNSTVSPNTNVANDYAAANHGVETYLERNKEYLTGPEAIESPQLTQMLASQNDGVSGSSDVVISDLGRVELPWYNGNYLVWNTDTGYNDMYFAAEYNRQKNLVGLVVLVKEDDGIFCAKEYLKSGDWSVPLKSVFIYDSKNNAAFLYGNNKSLKMYQINNQKKVENSSDITNMDFISQIIPKLNNPKRYIIPYND